MTFDNPLHYFLFVCLVNIVHLDHRTKQEKKVLKLYYGNNLVDKLCILVSGVYGLSGCIWVLRN